MTTNSKYDKYLMYFNTVQGAPVKILTEALKEVITDININFDKDGFRIIDIDPKGISYVCIELLADKFEEFYCPRRLSIGVNMGSIYKLLKTIGNNDTLTMYISKENSEKLGIIIQNKKKRINNHITYNLKDVDMVQIDIPDIDYDALVSMPCNDFQKYCRELVNLSNNVKVFIGSNKVFRLTVYGDYAEQTLDIQESDDSNVIIQLNDNIFEDKKNIYIGEYSLKFLNLFNKSGTLCNTIELYMKEGYPLIIVFTVASLGTLKYCLNTHIEDT